MPKLRLATPLCYTLFFATLHTLTSFSQTPPTHPHVHFIVNAPSTLTAPISGRLLIFLKSGTGDTEVSTDELHPTAAWVGAREVQNLSTGASVEIDPDADGMAFPTPFASIAPGDYEMQAVLDVDHTYNYSGRSPQDWISPVVALPHWTPGEGPEPTLELTQHPTASSARTASLAKANAQVAPGVVQLKNSKPAPHPLLGPPHNLQAGSSCRPAIPSTQRTLPHRLLDPRLRRKFGILPRSSTPASRTHEEAKYLP